MSDEKNTSPEAQDEQPYEGILGDFQETEDAPEPEKPEKKGKKSKADKGTKDAENDKASKEKKDGGKKGAVIAGISASVVLLGCLGYLGVSLMREATHGAIMTKTMHVSKEMLECYYQDIINMYVEYYGEEALASYYQLDVSKPLKDQPYVNGDGTTWFYQVMEQAKQTAAQELQVAEAAKKAGFKMTPEMQEQVEEDLKTYDLSTFPESVTEDDLRDMLRLQTYAMEYFNVYADELEFSDEEIEAYFSEHQSEYESCGIAYFSFVADDGEEAPEEETSGEEAPEEETSGEEAPEEETSGEEAPEEETSGEEAPEEETSGEEAPEEETPEEEPEQNTLTSEKAAALAEKFRNAGTTDKFEELALGVLTEYQGYTQEEAENVTGGLYSNEFTYTQGSELAEWAFGGAKVGESYVIENEGVYYVYMLTREPGRDDSKTIDIRHILFMTNNHLGEDGDAEAALAECRTLAEDCLNTWKNGEATEESFSKLAEELTEDTGSQSKGGLYEYVSEGDMVSSFNDWCFDPSRQVGDTDLVESDYGIHVMYFVGDNDPVWKANINAALGNAAIEEWFASLEEAYPLKYDDELIDSIEG